jgi:SAM-dependent methyltransferase
MSAPNPVHVYESFEDAHWWYIGRRTVLMPLIHTLVPAGEGRKLVDIGCGAGANVAAFADSYECVGIDISEELIVAGRRRFPGVQFLTGDAPADLGRHAGNADVFLLMDVIEHIPDDHGYFARIFNAAKEGAVFVVTVPAGPALWSPHDVAVGHQRRYTPETLAALWADLPAQQLLLDHFNSHLYPLIRAARVLTNRIGRGAGGSGTDFVMPPAAINRCLAWVMGSEKGALMAALQGRHARAYRRGVSLVAIVRKAPQFAGGTNSTNS